MARNDTLAEVLIVEVAWPDLFVLQEVAWLHFHSKAYVFLLSPNSAPGLMR